MIGLARRHRWWRPSQNTGQGHSRDETETEASVEADRCPSPCLPSPSLPSRLGHKTKNSSGMWRGLSAWLFILQAFKNVYRPETIWIDDKYAQACMHTHTLTRAEEISKGVQRKVCVRVCVCVCVCTCMCACVCVCGYWIGSNVGCQVYMEGWLSHLWSRMASWAFESEKGSSHCNKPFL